ncbi:MAG: hypothetical protein HY578_00850 [Nitrospinae bacterium]|nr:hypothetical protein [Nitrospinota bacterium]
MISCTETVLAYNEMFSFLHKRYGKKAVVKFWEDVSDEFLRNLRELVKEKGIKGMREYWGKVLKEEEAKYKIRYGRDFFRIEMYRCPSVGLLRRHKGINRYKDYCKHCDILYRRIIEDYGFSYSIEYMDNKKGICRVEARKII